MTREQMIAWLVLEGWELRFWQGMAACPRLVKGPIILNQKIWQWLGTRWQLAGAAPSHEYYEGSWGNVNDGQLRLLMEKLV